MVRVLFDGSQLRLDNFQTGGGYSNQIGYGSFYVGYPRQRGEGVASILRGLWRYIRPMALSAGKAIGEEGLAATARILNNVVQGGDVKESVESEGRQGLANLLGKAQQKIAPQKGKGYKRKLIGRSKPILKPGDLIGRSVPASSIRRTDSGQRKKNNRSRSDIFGIY